MDWQAVIATIVVISAALWWARRVWRIVKSGARGGDGEVVGCGTCHKNPETGDTATPLVQLGKNSKS